MVELHGDELRFSFPEIHEHAVCSLSFRRTLRIPDDEREHSLPPGLGAFPLHHVDDYADRLPAAWRESGGVFTPMYQAEALSIRFDNFSHHDATSTWGGYPMAFLIAAGKIDALTGEPFSDVLRVRPQNYLVAATSGAELDGFCAAKGLGRQFVVMPLGKDHAAEKELTGTVEQGVLQIVAYPMKATRYKEILAHESNDVRTDTGPMAWWPPIPVGRRQKNPEDWIGFDAWDQDARSRCFVYLLNSAQYRAVTGAVPPHLPPHLPAYTALGLSHEDYDADRMAPGRKHSLDEEPWRRTVVG